MTAARTRRTRWLLIAAVVVLLAVAAGGPALGWPRGDDSDARSGPVVPISVCPERWGTDQVAEDPWVPVAPSVPRASSRLVPDAAPTAALVCGYTGPTTALTAHAVLTGDLGPVAATLAGLPRKSGEPICAYYAAFTDDDDYLVGLTYPDGTLWVSAPRNHCTGASNGAFTTTTNVGADVAAWLAAKTSVTTPDDDATSVSDSACPTADGRLGQDAAMVPDTPSTLTICVSDGVSADRVVGVPAGRIAGVVAVLNALATVTSTSSCQGPPQGDVDVLVFGYAAGPGVRVSVIPGCDPPVDNGALQSPDSSDLLPLLADLTG